MKMTRKFAGTLAMMGFMVFIAGCRPTIEFKSNSTTAAPGETVTLEWEVEFAKGTSSSKVTITDLGEVEPEGTGEVVVDETKDFQLRVSTFVLGMPITSKQSLTINVPEDNFKVYDFESGGSDGWEENYAFYDERDNEEGDGAEKVLCWDTTSSSSGALLNQLPSGNNGLKSSLKLCLDNDASNEQEENNRYSLGFLQRKIRDGDDFEIERGKTYKVGYEVRYGIKFSDDTCNDIDKKLNESGDETRDDDKVLILDNLSFIVGAAHDEVDTREIDNVIELELESFVSESQEQFLKDSLDADKDYAVNGPFFDNVMDQSSLSSLKVQKQVLSDAIGEPEDEFEEFIKKGCENPSGNVAVPDIYFGIRDGGYVEQTANEDKELWLFFGFYNKTDEDDIEIFIDQIKVQLIEQ